MFRAFLCLFFAAGRAILLSMVQEINRWLNSDQDYAAGVALYHEHGESDVRKRMFASGFSSFNHDKLVQSLKELAAATISEPDAKAAPEPAKTSEKTPAKPAKVTPANPELYEQIMVQLRALFDERTITHSRLDSTRLSDQQRLKLALRIHELVPEIKKLQQVRQYVLEHGKMPEEKGRTIIDENDKACLIQHRNNLRSKCSKLKKKPEKASELEALKSEIERLTTLIKEK